MILRTLALLPALLSLGLTSATAAIPPKRENVWAQTYVDRLPDPAVRYGQLPNGMRYAILRNATPPGQMAMRLVIKSGSLVEPAGSEGLAHFLEHMAFRGSTNVVDGEVMRMLQRRGLAPGADTNAATSPESTIYQFDFPQGGKDNLDTGLMLFREIAGNLTIDQKTVEAERGAVLSEERLRDGPQMRATRAMLRFALPGQLAPDRLPIGKVEVIAHANAPLLRAFYEAHYRPDNAAVIVVGDVDPGAVEAAIKARFSDWKAKRPAPPRPVLGKPVARGQATQLFSEPGSPTNIQIGWLRPYDDRSDTAERTREDMNRLAGMIVLNQRMGDLARSLDPPFIGAAVGQNNLLKSANLTSLQVSATTGRQLPAMRAAIDEQRRAVQFGISQAEFERAIATMKALYTNAASGADTRQSNELAARMAQDVVDNEVTRSPDQDLEDFQRWSSFVKLKDVDGAMKAAFQGSGPVLFLASPQPPAGGVKAITTAFAQANSDKLVAAAVTETKGWPYAAFGTPGRVVEKTEIADLGVTDIRFENGVKLLVKPTKFSKGQIFVGTGFGQGRLGLPINRAHAYWMVTGGTAFTDGGTGKITAADMQKLMAGRLVGARLQIQDDHFELAGATQPQDLLTQLQIEAAYITDPGFRPEAVTRMQNALATLLPQLDATPSSVLSRQAAQLLHGGDARWSAVPTAEQLAQSRPQDLILTLEPALSGPLTVTIVGDTTVDQAVDAVAQTLGALPPRGTRVAAPSGGISFPQPTRTPKVLPHLGRPDQAIAFVAWPTTDFYRSPSDARSLLVTAAVIRQRLFDSIREKEGSTYSPGVSANSPTTLDNYGYFSSSVEMPPARIPGFYASLDAIIADLKAHPVSADELDRAKKPLIEERTRNRQENSYWYGALTIAQYDPKSYDGIRTRVSGIEKVSAADIQRVVASYLAPERAYRLTVLPSETAAAPVSPAMVAPKP